MDLSRCILMDDNDRIMIQDAINAINLTEMWDYMKKQKNPDGFMFSTDPELDIINKKIQYSGHSGASHAWTLRQVEDIAKNGFDTYVEMMNNGSIAPSSIYKQMNARAKMLAQTNTNMSFADQLKSITEFADVPMSYTEMRTRYG